MQFIKTDLSRMSLISKFFVSPTLIQHILKGFEDLCSEMLCYRDAAFRRFQLHLTKIDVKKKNCATSAVLGSLESCKSALKLSKHFSLGNYRQLLTKWGPIQFSPFFSKSKFVLAWKAGVKGSALQPCMYTFRPICTNTYCTLIIRSTRIIFARCLTIYFNFTFTKN